MDRIVIGLGNPGDRYRGTRHNVGFAAVEALAERVGVGSESRKFQADVAQVRIGKLKVLLIKPRTYMNESGQSVQAAMAFYRVPKDQILLVCDDYALDLGRLRLRASGSAGSHNGLRSAIRAVGGVDLARLRLGIGAPPPYMDTADFVLARFGEGERAAVEQMAERAAMCIATWCSDGIDSAMAEYNGLVEETREQGPENTRPQAERA